MMNTLCKLEYTILEKNLRNHKQNPECITINEVHFSLQFLHQCNSSGTFQLKSSSSTTVITVHFHEQALLVMMELDQTDGGK